MQPLLQAFIWAIRTNRKVMDFRRYPYWELHFPTDDDSPALRVFSGYGTINFHVSMQAMVIRLKVLSAFCRILLRRK
jgi:hypothetical protein